MKKGKDSLGDRMKRYENVSRNYLMNRNPVVIRLDGRSFHTFTKGLLRPFDDLLIETMWEAAKYLCQNIQGCKLAYVQSDEISLLLTDYEKLDTSAWFDNNIQKIVSISASMATLSFNKAFRERVEALGDLVEDDLFAKYYNTIKAKLDLAMFDSRVFSLPKEEVVNYFLWREQDAMRNSVQMVGRANFSHKELHKKSTNDIKNMLINLKDMEWDRMEVYKQRGACIIKESYSLQDDEEVIRNRWVVDKDIPIFSEDREYIGKYL